MMQRVTDPNILSQLNAPDQGSAPQGMQRVTDPSVLAQLNNTHGSQSSSSLHDRYMNFMNPNKTDSQGRPLVNTFLGRMPDPSYSDNSNHITQMPSQEDMQKSAGIMTMLMAPELKLGAMLPGAIRSMLPELSGGAKIAKDYLSTVGKTGAGAYLGTKMMPGSTEGQADTAGATGTGLAAAITPLTMLFGSMNPVSRILAGSGLGTLGGYVGSQIAGGGAPYLMPAGGIAGALLGARGAGASQLAAQNMAQAVTPEQMAMATQRNAAASQIGVPLTAAESTGSPVLGQMQQQAASSTGGSKVLYPFGLARQKAEENAYENLLNKISPKNAKSTIEDEAFTSAAKNADQQGVKVNVQPVVDYIDQQLPKFESGSKIATALNMAKNRLNLTPQTAQKYTQLMSPITQMESKLQSNMDNLQQQLSQMKSQAPDPYFRASTGYDQRLQALQSNIAQHQSALENISQQKDAFLKANNISNYENTVEGLHNAKMGIQGLIEGQGDQAIGRTAGGALKQVNKRLNAQLKEASPEYAQATQISNMRQARESIEDAMTKSSITGSNFYDKVLTNRNEYQNLYNRLGNPKAPNTPTPAQKNLAAMREAFPDLMDNITAKSGASLAAQHPEIHTSFQGLAKGFLNKIYLDRYNKAVADLLVNPKWQDELSDVAKMKAGEDRGIRLGRLISKVATAGGMAAFQNKQQGSEYNDSSP